MSKENTEHEQTETPVPQEPWVQEMQLSDDDLDAVIGGLKEQCGSTYKTCGGSYSS